MSELIEPLGYLNGRILPAANLSIAPTDAGFVLGVTVAEQLRTFGGELFRWDAHLRRFQHSLAIVGVDIPVSFDQLHEAACQLVQHNRRQLERGDDLGLSLLATPGTYSTFRSADEPPAPQVIMHTYPLPFYQWAAKFQTGQILRTTSIKQVPSDCWPTELKCRSRMHYYLADREAAVAEPGARALLISHDGQVTEASTANLVISRGDTLLSPPLDRILPGISAMTLQELAEEQGIAWHHQPLTEDDLREASEIILTSTSVCLLPVSRFNGQNVGNHPKGTFRPGPVFSKLLDAWGKRVGVDIAAQAQRYAQRGVGI